MATLVGSVTATLLLVLLASQIVRSGDDSRRGLDERLELRTVLAEQFIESYDDDLTASISRHARVALSGPMPSAAEFSATVTAMGFKAGVLLDDQGRLMQVFPEKPEILGETMTGKYDHLRRAVAGEPAVSGVVPSAAVGEPVVAFAVPYDTALGRRVFSAGFSVVDTPLGAFLENASSLPGQSVYLIDSTGSVLASSDTASAAKLADRDPDLASALSTTANGVYHRDGGTVVYTSAAIAGTPWRIATAVPADDLYRPLQSGRWTPWVLFASFVLVAALAVLSLRRLTGERGEADRTAQIDGLTGLVNRRQLDAELVALPARLGPGTPWAVLLIDVDHFKQVNDNHGHSRGDEALRSIAQAMTHATRPGDIVGRWGGEEFMVLLPGANLDAAATAAERIRKAVAALSIDDLSLTVSVGYAATTDTGDIPDGLVDLADDGLYHAKQSGRNQCATLAAEKASPAFQPA